MGDAMMAQHENSSMNQGTASAVCVMACVSERRLVREGLVSYRCFQWRAPTPAKAAVQRKA